MLVRLWRHGMLCNAGENVRWCGHYGKQYGGPSKKFKLELQYDPAIPILGYSQSTESKDSTGYLYTNVHSSIIPAIAKRWKQPKCPSMDDWINKTLYIHTMEYYSLLKRDKFLIYATIWINLEDVMLGEISQTQMLYD